MEAGERVAEEKCHWQGLVSHPGDVHGSGEGADPDFLLLRLKVFEMIPRHRSLFQGILGSLLVDDHWQARGYRALVLVGLDDVLNLFAAVGEFQSIIGFSAECLRWRQAGQHGGLAVSTETVLQDGCELAISVWDQIAWLVLAQSIDNAC